MPSFFSRMFSKLQPGYAALPPGAQVRVVDQLHRGDHATITAAIEAANPGDRIVVRPGVYEEGLVINKALEIIGEGALDTVVIQATGRDGVWFEATRARLVNLTIRQVGGGDWFGVDITQGCLELEGCDITSQSLACVAIHDSAAPCLRRNRIHDGKQSGVYVYENGQGVLEGNEICGNALSGVIISEGGSPTLRRNRVRANKEAGVYVHENGQGVLEGNEIAGNASAGVFIRTGGSPTLRRNRIHGNKIGVLVCENGEGTLEGNEIFDNASSGVYIGDGGNPTLRRNRVRDNKETGVCVDSNGQGTLEDNDISGTERTYGVEILKGGTPTLRDNRIKDGVYREESPHRGGPDGGFAARKLGPKQFVSQPSFQRPQDIGEIAHVLLEAAQQILSREKPGPVWKLVQDVTRHPTEPEALYFRLAYPYEFGPVKGVVYLGCVVAWCGWDDGEYFTDLWPQPGYVVNLAVNFQDSNQWAPALGEHIIRPTLQTLELVFCQTFRFPQRRMWRLTEGGGMGPLGYT
jgi:parallel beta-helix repeat protein